MSEAKRIKTKVRTTQNRRIEPAAGGTFHSSTGTWTLSHFRLPYAVIPVPVWLMWLNKSQVRVIRVQVKVTVSARMQKAGFDHALSLS